MVFIIIFVCQKHYPKRVIYSNTGGDKNSEISSDKAKTKIIIQDEEVLMITTL